MKRVIAGLFVTTLVFLASINPIIAQAPTTTASNPSPTKPQAVFATRAQERIDNMENRIDAKKEKIEERTASREAKLDARKQSIVDKIVGYANRLLERANRRIERLDNIWKKIEARMDKMKAAGKDLSSVNSLVADVQAKRQAAVLSISSAKTAVTALQGSNEPKTAFQTVKGQLETVLTAIKAYHQSILAVIRSLKGMSGANVTKTPTSSGTVTVTVTGTP